jgi:signal transduction histidine kinase
MSKIDAGKMTVELQPVSLDDLLNGKMFLFQRQAQDKNINLEMQIKQSPSFAVLTDPLRLRQILRNLISNALKV